jgi:P4 family phage/plasmid primase-like protien
VNPVEEAHTVILDDQNASGKSPAAKNGEADGAEPISIPAVPAPVNPAAVKLAQLLDKFNLVPEKTEQPVSSVCAPDTYCVDHVGKVVREVDLRATYRGEGIDVEEIEVEWQEVSEARPCIKCGSREGCYVSPAGTWLACRRVKEGAWGDGWNWQTKIGRYQLHPLNCFIAKKLPGNKFLLHGHWVDLQRSGLALDQIQQAGLHSEWDPLKIQCLLKWKKLTDTIGPVLVFRYPDSAGNPTKYVRVKPDRPPIDDGGKAAKYLGPKGGGCRLYYPPGSYPHLANPCKPLLIVEGEKKALRVDQEGYVAVGVGGIWNWIKSQSADTIFASKALADDFAAINCSGRVVYLVFDSDAITTPLGRRALTELGLALKDRGADVRIVILPAGEMQADGTEEKVGADDYLQAHTKEEFDVLLQEALPVEQFEHELPVQVKWGTARWFAQLYLRRLNGHDSWSKLRFWQEEWYRWREGRFYRLPLNELEADVHGLIEKEFEKVWRLKHKVWEKDVLASGADKDPTTAAAKKLLAEKPQVVGVPGMLVDSVVRELQSRSLVRHQVALGSWLTASANDDGAGVIGQRQPRIALANGLYDVDALVSESSACWQALTPQWFATTILPYAYNPDAQCDLFKKMINRSLGGNKEKIALLQEWYGYNLVYDNTLQKFMVFVGEGCNGKSVVQAGMTALLGPENVSHVGLESFSEKFALAATLGKLANIAPEVGEFDKTDEGRLKSFTSGDLMQFDRKFLPPIDAVPTARLTLITNTKPRFRDRSNGIWRRLLLLGFDVTIAKEDRILGADKPQWWLDSGELPGMLNWALEGLRRLMEQKKFTEPKESAAEIAEYRLDSHCELRFLGEHCRHAPDKHVGKDLLYVDYSAWCRSNGDQPLPSNMFGKAVVKQFPHLHNNCKRYSNEAKRRYWGYPDLEYSFDGFEDAKDSVS